MTGQTECKWMPGPWEVCHMDNWCCVDQAEWGVTVAEIGENDDIGLSNAHLIAAAPDLYEALEKCLRGYEMVAHSEFDGVWSDKDFEVEFAPFKRALAKARGEQ